MKVPNYLDTTQAQFCLYFRLFCGIVNEVVPYDNPLVGVRHEAGFDP